MEFSIDTTVGLKRWNYPFPYYTMQNVYSEDVYTKLAEAVKRLLEMNTFRRNMTGYDALGAGIQSNSPDPLPMFVTSAMRTWLSSLFNIPPTPYVNAGLHHHLVGSKNGFIHNDYNPVYFPKVKEDVGDIIQLSAGDNICSYKFGTGNLAPNEKICVVRGVVMIYYLLNDDWKTGDGGGTGLYLSRRTPISGFARQVPPINNSLVAYECTPQSWHSFISNTRLTRTSIIMWIHRPYDEAIAKHGEENLERWTE